MKRNLLILVISLISSVYSQSAFEPVNSDVYDYLQKLSIKGIITFDYEVKPITRIEIAKKLIEADIKKSELNEIDNQLLTFYLQDFQHEIKLVNKENIPVSNPEFFIVDKEKRMRFFEYANNNFSFFADPMLSFSAASIAGERLFIRRNGFSFYGYVLDNWAYGLNFFDNEETGKNLDVNKDLTPERGTSITKIKKDAFEYDVVNASIGYYWNDGSISIGKDYFKIGSGRNGNIILSDKAPSFPFIRFDFKPVDWLRFFYFHGFLISNVPDSSTFKYNRVQNRTSISDVPKFIALHSLSIYPTDNFSFTLGESIVYSDQIQPIYLIPVMFFRVADHFLGRGKSSATGNAQLFADISYKNFNLKSNLYSSLFIDELSLNSIFEGGNLSAIGFTVGLESYDILTENSSINLEYSRINPFVYMNSADAQTFTNDDYALGHWMGSNGDLLSVSYRQDVLRSLSFSLKTWYLRKGKKELPDEQYQTPYPSFLYGEKRYEYGVDIRVKYRPWHPLNAEAYYSFMRITDELSERTLDYKLSNNHYFGITLNYDF